MLAYGEVVDDAAERAGLDPSALTHRHLSSMHRSLLLVFTEIEAAGANPEYRVETNTMTLPANQRGLILPADTIDVLDVVARPAASGDGDIALTRTSRQEYLHTSAKQTSGRPTSYWVSKTMPGEDGFVGAPGGGFGSGLIGYGGVGGTAGGSSGIEQSVLVLWPIASEMMTVTFNRLRHTATPGSLGDTIDARRNWIETIIRGLAAKTAEKFNPDREAGLLKKFEMALASRLQSEDRGDVHMAFRAFGHSRRRRF